MKNEENKKSMYVVVGMVALSFLFLVAMTTPLGATLFNGTATPAIMGTVDNRFIGYFTTVDANVTVSAPILNATDIYTDIPKNRKFATNESQTYTVCSSGCDYSTIQSAVDDIPLFVLDSYTIDVQNGEYNEHVTIPPFFTRYKGELAGGNGYVAIAGNKTISGSTFSTHVNVTSIASQGAFGKNALHIHGINIIGNHTADDEGAGIEIYGGSSEVKINWIRFDSTQTNVGVVCYDAKCKLRNIDFGDHNINYGVMVKHGGLAYVDDSGASTLYGLNGSVNKNVFWANMGEIRYLGDDDISGDNGLVKLNWGYAIDTDNYEVWGMREFPYGLNLSQNLAVHLGFEQNGQASSTQTAYDSSRNRNDGTLGNTTSGDAAEPAWVAGKVGSALSFDGSDDYVNVTDSDSVSITSQDMTILAWVKPTAQPTKYGGIVRKNYGAFPAPYDFYYNGVANKIYFLRGNGTSDFSSISFPHTLGTNVWTHIAVVQDGWTVRVYENGERIRTETMSQTDISDADTALLIGARDDFNADAYWNGSLDSIKIYNDSLSKEEIRADYLGLGPQAIGHLALK